MHRLAVARVMAVAVLLAAGASAPAQELGAQARQQLRAIFAEKASRTPTERKLATSLLYASRESRGLAMVQGLPPQRRVAARAGVDREGMVVVDIRGEVTDALLETIAATGGRVLLTLPAYGATRARLPVRRVDAIAALPEVRFVAPRQGYLVNVVVSEGDVAHAAESARTTRGIDGTGVKVGVLSDGVDTLAARQLAGELPDNCAASPGPESCVTVLPGQAGSGDEGTAMMEIVHDLAPAAKLYFATAVSGSASFAANILALKNTYGCQVIVDDVTYFDEGAFQDGEIAQAVKTVATAGALYFSSAGNSGRQNTGTSGTWEGDYLNSGTSIALFDGTDWQGKEIHSWNGVAGGSAANANALTSGAPYVISLKWSDPLGAAATDYDLFLFSSDMSAVLDASVDDQAATREPLEIMGFGDAGEKVVVVRWSGPTRALRLDTNRGRLTHSTAGAVFGHNGAESAITVAATDAASAGGGAFAGGSANPIESYSSDGPRRMFYNPDGTAITPGNVLFGTAGGRDLQKPDVTAADCVTTTTPGFEPFCGTSAAAPHAAAIGALLLSASPAPTPSAVGAAMTSSVLDVDPAGPDRDSGMGIVMADRPYTVADVAVAVAGPATVARGTNAVYTITVTANGPGSASSVQLADPTPTGLTFVSNAGDCTTPFPCSLGSLAVGEARTITATFSLPVGYSGASPLTNTATVSSGTTDPVAANNSASATTVAYDEADLSITKTGLSSVVRGTNVVYSIVVTNGGPSNAGSVQVADPAPAGLSFVSNAGDCTSAFPCSLGTLAPGATRTITATFAVPAGYAGPSPFTNTATVSSATNDPTPANNSSSADTTAASQADLAILKTGPATVARGTSAAYTIVVTNAGPSDAGSVQVIDATPTGLTFVSNTGACTTPFPCSLGTLPSGATRTITTTFSVPSSYSVASPFTNTATVSSATPDLLPANNSSSAQTAATSQADLSITKTGPASVARGTNVSYTIVVSNTGPSDADVVQVADATPVGLTFISNAGDCTTAFPCSLGTLPSGATRTITTSFTVPSGYSGASPLTNMATVSSTATDPTPANNSSSAQTTVTSQADLSITKTGPASVVRGTNVSYTIVVSNAGPSDANVVQVADATPVGLTFVSNAGDCTTAFPCSLGTIPPAATRTVTATFGVPLDYSGASPFTNLATVASATTDPSPANNSSSAQTTATEGADLGITNTGPPFATRGANLAYTIVVTNLGPSPADAVAVDDSMPADLAFVSNTGDCTTDFPCALGPVPPGATRTITTTLSVPAGHDVSAPLSVTATASSPTDDPNPTNDSATATSLFGAFYTVAPCRLVDSRTASQPLEPDEERTLVVSGPPCGIPIGTVALSLNLTVTEPTAPGNLRLYPADVSFPEVSTINFVAGRTRANNAIVPATADGSVAIKVKNSSAGTVHFILDVNGYFE